MKYLFALFALAACGDDTIIATDSGTDASTPDVTVNDVASESAADVVVDAPPDVAPEGPHVRIMAANLTSGTKQSYEDPGIRIFQGLKPDIALMQEFNYPAGSRALVDAAFGTEFSVYVEPSGNIPNGIVSRYPIVDAGAWVDASTTDRSFVWARIAVPGSVELFAVSLHLLTTGATQRDTEAKQIVGYVNAALPPADYLVIGGDFNTDTPSEACMIDLSALVNIAAPYPMDQQGNVFTSINRNRPHDWLLAGPTLDALHETIVIGFSTFPSGLVFDSRVYTPLSDVSPILIGDSATTGMQHMPVVRDFLITN